MIASDLEQQAEYCAKLIRQSQRIVLLSGAGMSTAAGIPDFRGPNGLYKTAKVASPEMIFDINGFFNDPTLFYSFHRSLLKTLDEIEPTFTHRFFAALEDSGRFAGIITQNIDSLHQRAGSKNVLEIHGGIWKSFCTNCDQEYDFETSRQMTFEQEIPRCQSCQGVIKPDIVFYGEGVKYLYECQQLAEQADLLFVVGSTLVVTPAAILPSLTKGRIVVVNMGEVSPIYLPPQRIDQRVDEDIDTFFQKLNDHLELL